MYYGERFNSISHLVATALALVGASVLITLAATTGDPWKIVSCCVYGAITVFLFAFSTLYHSLKGRAKYIFRKLDHVAIYLMIAGTYTPFTLVNMRSGNGWWVFTVVWALAAIGIFQELVRKTESRRLSLAIYLIMGWFIVFSFHELWQTLSAGALIFLLLGGAIYMIGVVFYIFDDKWKHAHGVWHLFVLVGSFCEYLSVTLSVL